MEHALALAKKAESLNEIPVGAVLVLNNELIGEGWNQPIKSHDPSSHAEINALRQASFYLKNYRLTNATLYVTLEPCLMCAGAIIHARIKRLVYGALDAKTGAVASVFNVFQKGLLSHSVQVDGSILAEQSAQLLRAFFKKRRVEHKNCLHKT